MSTPRHALLADRGVIAVTGEDAGKLLQGIVTNDMALLERQPAIHAALLTPQGKILFDFFVVQAPGGFLLDVGREKAAELVKRLTMYRLRAKAEIADTSKDHRVLAVWDGAFPQTRDGMHFQDPRLPALGERAIVSLEIAAAIAESWTDAAEMAAHGCGEPDYHAHRISLGVPEGGKDYPFGDAFPHEALLDQLNGVSFTKGCYVGQEIVSRMEHRGTARKRIVPVIADAPLPATGAAITAGEAAIGTLGSTAGSRGLALLRLDRAAEAIARGEGIRAGGVPVRIELPAFATFRLEAKGGEAAPA